MTDTVTVFMCDGTHALLDWVTGALIPIPDNPLIPTTLPALINTDLCTLQTITWPDSAFPMAVSMEQGVTVLAEAIQACTTDFILCGYSQGAGICSLALNELQSGSLTDYASQFLGGVTFGNICRQLGCIAPVQTDPGGEGVWASNLLTDTPDNWWDFALPLDVACAVPDTPFGVTLQTLFSVISGSFSGPGNLLEFLASEVMTNLDWFVQCLQSLGDLVLFGCALCNLIPYPPGMINFDAHAGYGITEPPGTTGDNVGLTCAQLAANYINELAATALGG